MNQFDVVVLTDRRYLHPVEGNQYIENIITEDTIVVKALQDKGLRVTRINWDDPEFDWISTRYALFRTTWDYFDRFAEFDQWLKSTSSKTTFLNDLELVRWNMDKHYLNDLAKKGINIPPTNFIEPGAKISLKELTGYSPWDEFILKPAISGSGRHTYRFNRERVEDYETIFKDLVASESMLLQEFQKNILTKGEVAFMVIGGKFTHAILKLAKPGDFRVQDDFGGTVHDYQPSIKEIAFAENLVQQCTPIPLYARVDVIWDNNDEVCITELELIEPELWFRKNPQAANQLAEVIYKLF